MKRIAFFVVSLILILAACGPVGPALGLGPGLGPFVGPVLLVALIFGSLWVVKSAVRSPTGQAIERSISEAGQSIRDQVRSETHEHSSNQAKENSISRAEEILKERYARGEIDRKQYLEMLGDLKNQ